jgi:hypothetical protein
MSIASFSVERFKESRARYEREWRKVDDCLYGFVRKHPGHSGSESEYVCVKVFLVNRVYQANVHLKIPEYDLAEHLRKTFWLDENLAGLDGYLDFDDDSWSPVVDLHKKLVALGREWSGAELEVFFSKYLHFHCPQVVPIYDNRAWDTLEDHIPASTFSGCDTYYDNFCRRFLQLYQQAKDAKHISGEVNVRALDYYLYLGKDLEAEGDPG